MPIELKVKPKIALALLPTTTKLESKFSNNLDNLLEDLKINYDSKKEDLESSPWFNQARYLSNNFGVLPENRLVIDHSDNHAQIEKLVGGKNRQLAWLHQIREQMIKDGIQDPINVPDGSALTAKPL